MIGKNTNEINQELFDSLLNRYQERLEQSRESVGFVFDHVNGLYYKSHKISLRHFESYIDSPELDQKQKSYRNSKNNDNNCFQYAVTVPLNHVNIEKHPERTAKISIFIGKYDCEEINLPSEATD